MFSRFVPSPKAACIVPNDECLTIFCLSEGLINGLYEVNARLSNLAGDKVEEFVTQAYFRIPYRRVMTSQGTLSSRAGGAGGVSWQVDLPGLASLVMNLGAAGLKRFAQAGVDVHTILCMGEIAEKCPASAEYRKQIMTCRQEQRSQSRWLFNVVEIGAATSFVADELLKTRAGENVVALMSTILPILPESRCDRVILKLFEESGAPLDKTPGLSQLHSIRQTLASLANEIDFKDKVFQYHVFLSRLLDSPGDVSKDYVGMAIPDESTMSKLIVMLSRLMLDSKLRIEYRGFNGCSWLVTYAKHILGLPVCVMKSASSAVPISGDTESARILVHIYDWELNCKLLSVGSLQDVIKPEAISLDACGSWAVHVDNVNLMDLHIEDDQSMRRILTIVGYSLLEDYVRFKAREIPISHLNSRDQFRKAQLTGYTEYCLSNILAKARRIFSSLGLDLGHTEMPQGNQWEQYVVLESSKKNAFPDMNIFSAKPGKAWLAESVGHVTRPPPDTGHTKHGQVFAADISFDRIARHSLKFIFRAVRAASWLALTNWESNLRTISITFLGSNFRPDQDDTDRTQLQACSLSHIAHAVTNIALGSRKANRVGFQQPEVFAYQQRGVVVCNAVAAAQTFDLNACYIDLVPGSISLHGEPASRIISPAEGQFRLYEESNSPRSESLKPVNMFKQLKANNTFEIEDGEINLHQTVLIDEQLYWLRTPGDIFQSLINCCLPPPCNHGYEMGWKTSKPFSLGLQVSEGHQNFAPETRVQAVDQNPLGQFIAYQSSSSLRCFSLLQRDCCLSCTFDTLARVRNVIAPIYPGSSNIIFARLPDEDMP